MSKLRHHISALAAAAALFIGAAAPAWAQDIAQIAQSDPLIISGAVGTQNTYRYTSSGNGYGSPLSNMIYANLDIKVYGISMPFSFYYSNDNLAFNYPQFSLNMSPSYKNWTGHIGQSSMQFSPYVLNMSFNGVGLEYNSERLRSGVFYGVLRKAINDDPTDAFARTPQYKRLGWGLKVGYGTGRNYLDLYFLSAFDREGSLNEQWRRYISPQENLVVGLKGCVTPCNWMSFSANAAASLFTTDTNAPRLTSTKDTNGNESTPVVDGEGAALVPGTPINGNWDKIFTTRYSTNARFAGDANLNLNFRNISANVSYRLIQPEYTSLGTYYLSNNYHSLGLSANTFLFRRLSLSANLFAQEDNLTKLQLYTTRGFVYNANASMRFAQRYNITASYNGYTQRQSDGTAIVNDTTRVDRRMSSFSVSPTASFEGDVLSHSISASVNYSQNFDRNKFVAKRNDIKTLAIGGNYVVSVNPWDVDITTTYSHQQSTGYRSKYISDVGTIDLGRSFLSEKNLHVSAGINMCYNHIYWQSKSLSIGGQCSASYTLKKDHVFSANFSLMKYGDVNTVSTRSNLDVTNINASLNYVYTFSLFSIKSKKHKEQQQL